MSTRRARPEGKDTPDLPTELEIVDTFTRLIFGDEVYSPAELATVAALRVAEDRVSLDDFAGVGSYLRALGVPEMIELVHRVQQQLRKGGAMPSSPAVFNQRPGLQNPA